MSAVQGAGRRCLGLLLAVASWQPDAALASNFEFAPNKQALACIVKPEGPPAYPSGMAERKVGSLVRVRMTFAAADAAPEVEVFYNSGETAFGESVKRHVRAYRLPCMPANAAPVIAAQEFRFSPTDARQVFWSPERSERGMTEALLASCLSFGTGKPTYLPSTRPSWITSRKGQHGTVLADIRFDGVDLPPTVNILFDGGSAHLANIVLDFVSAQYRFTCGSASDFPVGGTQAFAFRVVGEPELRLKDVDLRTFVGALKDIDRKGAVFDFASMSCPFEVELHMYRPHAENGVGQVGAVDPNRREFIEWLKGATLSLKGDAARELVGAAMRISVPCGKLDLS